MTNYNPENQTTKVSFQRFQSTEMLVENLLSYGERNIILWFVGSYGLKKTCVDFYREEIIQPLLMKETEKTIFWLTDLTAWFGIKSANGSISKSSVIADKIESLQSNYFKVIKSSEILRSIYEFPEKPIATNLRSSVCSILEVNHNKNATETGISIGSIFPGDSSILSFFQDHDSGLFYSALQYIEGCFIVKKILKHLLESDKSQLSKKKHIQFVLPEDEYKYYSTQNGSFQKDLSSIVNFIAKRLGIDSLLLDIQFLSFPYDKNLSKRPYNGQRGDKSLKSIDFFTLCGLRRENIDT